MPDDADQSRGIRGATALKVARLLVIAALAAVILAAFVSIELPYLVIEPGPVRDVAELVEIEAPTHPSRGSFLLATALIRATDGVNVPTALRTLFDAKTDLVTRASVFPSGASRTQTDQLHNAQMSESQKEGAVAALAELGMRSKPDGAFVRQTSGESPAAGVLRPGDVITGIDSRPVGRLEDLLKVLANRRPGDEVRLTVSRSKTEKSFSVRTIKDEKTGKTKIGVEVIQNRRLPIPVKSTAQDIGGPSAGLMFALSIYDSLTPGDLTGGNRIAGTGTISNPGRRTGVVGAVGAVAQKIEGSRAAGARIFLAPRGEADAARRAAGPKIRVIEVSSLRQAIKELKKLETS